MAEWEPYKCSIGSGESPLLGQCGKLEVVRHIAHVSDARRIIEDGKLKARLVYDESRLNQTRMHVCWTSPNRWWNGSIYGTVEFSFDWSDLAQGKQVYWVEAMTAYNPTAYRLLLTDRSPSDLTNVVAYNPDTADGPLRRLGADWFWNNQYTAEFMFDGDISLGLCRRLNFVEHNPTMCRLYKAACTERGQYHDESAALILSYLVGVGNTSMNAALKPDLGFPDGKPSLAAIHSFASRIYLKFAGPRRTLAGSQTDGVIARQLVRAALLQYCLGDINEAHGLVGLLASKDIFEVALLDLIRTHFDVPDFTFE